MKKILAAFSGIVLSAVLLSSCAKEDYYSGSGQTGYNPFGNGSVQASQGTFTAKVDGSDFSAEMAVATVSSGVLVVGGSKGSGTPQQMIMLSTSGAGTGTFAIGGSASVSYKAAGTDEVLIGSSGELVVTERDETHVKGTFHFVASGVNVTDGAFNVKITKQ